MFPTRSDAVLQVRRRALMENNLLVKDTEIVAIMNRATRVIYKHCLTALGADTFAERCVISGIGSESANPAVLWPTTYQSVGGNPVVKQTEFPLPTDFYRLLRCDWCSGAVTSNTTTNGVYWTRGANKIDWCPMQRVEIRAGAIDDTPREWAAGLVGYWLKGTPGAMTFVEHGTSTTASWWIAFLPVPSLTVSVSIWYIPLAPAYSMQDDTNLIRLQDEAWDFVLNTAAAELLEKQGRDSSTRRAAAVEARGDLLSSIGGVDEENAWGTIDINAPQAPHGRRKNVWGP